MAIHVKLHISQHSAIRLFREQVEHARTNLMDYYERRDIRTCTSCSLGLLFTLIRSDEHMVGYAHRFSDAPVSLSPRAQDDIFPPWWVRTLVLLANQLSEINQAHLQYSPVSCSWCQ
jgi:hypothetical protein